MNDEVCDILRDLVARHGAAIASDSIRVEGLLRDTCPSSRRETFILVNAVRQRVPADLLNPRHSLPRPLLKGFLAKRLQDELGLSDDAAKWGVGCWEAALGLDREGRGDEPASEKKPVGPRKETAFGKSDADRGNPALRDQLAALLGDSSYETRLRGIAGLAHEGDGGSLEILVSALGNSRWQVRAAAFDALVAHGLTACPFLIAALAQGDLGVAARAALALGAIGDANAVGPLAGLLGEKGDLRYCAIRALGLIGNMEASGPLMKCLSDSDPKTSRLAEAALKLLHT